MLKKCGTVGVDTLKFTRVCFSLPFTPGSRLHMESIHKCYLYMSKASCMVLCSSSRKKTPPCRQMSTGANRPQTSNAYHDEHLYSTFMWHCLISSELTARPLEEEEEEGNVPTSRHIGSRPLTHPSPEASSTTVRIWLVFPLEWMGLREQIVSLLRWHSWGHFSFQTEETKMALWSLWNSPSGNWDCISFMLL